MHCCLSVMINNDPDSRVSIKQRVRPVVIVKKKKVKLNKNHLITNGLHRYRYFQVLR